MWFDVYDGVRCRDCVCSRPSTLRSWTISGPTANHRKACSYWSLAIIGFRQGILCRCLYLIQYMEMSSLSQKPIVYERVVNLTSMAGPHITIRNKPHNFTRLCWHRIIQRKNEKILFSFSRRSLPCLCFPSAYIHGRKTPPYTILSACVLFAKQLRAQVECPDSKFHGANMRPTWVRMGYDVRK